MILAPYTFQCKELLFVLGRMLPPPELSEDGTVLQAAAQLANTLSRNVSIVDDHELLVELDEPVEAVAIARQLELRIERCIAAPLALELLRESGEPARASWSWLCAQLKLPPNPVGSVVKLTGIERDRLPAGVDQIPDGPGVLLWIVDNPDRIIFVDRPHTIGRSDDANISLDHETVSRLHASIIPYQKTWAVQDQGSKRGTKVDGREVTSRCLVPGMTIRIGKVRLVVLSVR